MAKNENAAVTDLKAGLSNRSPMDGDKSMRCKGENVDAGATRKGTAPTPRTLGPRRDGM